ncbi:hypothetical protein [Streptomyces sp. NBC_00299]|uniref:hypothetical protein n=1 Tax=Streptomyces sp. NBC_00299 TaxID=2975705 RepID=UPI002E27DE32|nr:hypothetical protein [Streptomyces sp. NBC_00299]
MNRFKRLIGCGSALVVAVSTLAASAGGEKEEALQLARAACTMEFPEVSDDPLIDSAARQESRDRVFPLMEKAADKAAQAARLDDTRQPLATALSRSAELTSVTLELGDLRGTQLDGDYSDPADVDKDSQLDERRTKLINRLDEPNIISECRKTTGD